MQIFSALVVAVSLACAMAQDDGGDAGAPCVLEPYIAPGFDGINFIEMVSYHDTAQSLVLYETAGKPGEWRMFVDGKLYTSYEDGTCNYEQIVDDGFDISQLVSGAEVKWGVNDYEADPTLGFEYDDGDLAFRSIQRSSACSALFFGLSKNGLSKMIYFYYDETPAQPGDLQPLYDAVDFIGTGQCVEK